MSETRGRNNRRYVRNNRALRDSLPPYCSWCCEWVDVTLPPTDPMSWTTDHTVSLEEGGELYGHRTLMHRRCNTAKENERRAGAPHRAAPLRTTEAW